MPKRYGRNQKRKHREEIARWKQAYEMSDGLCKHISSKLREANDTLAEMVEIIKSVSEYSVALPPKTVKGTRPADRYEVAAYPSLEFSAVFDDRVPFPSSPRRINLFALRAFMEDRRDRFQAAIHLEYSAGPHSAYMISEDALYSLPRETLLRRVLPEIGTALIEHLRRR